jgi:hypothetical protein
MNDPKVIIGSVVNHDPLGIQRRIDELVTEGLPQERISGALDHSSTSWTDSPREALDDAAKKWRALGDA